MLEALYEDPLNHDNDESESKTDGLDRQILGDESTSAEDTIPQHTTTTKAPPKSSASSCVDSAVALLEHAPVANHRACRVSITPDSTRFKMAKLSTCRTGSQPFYI